MRSLLVALTLLAASSRAMSQDMPLSQVLIDGEGWTKIDAGCAKILELRSHPSGAVYVMHADGLKRIDVGGAVSPVDQESRTPSELGITVQGRNGTTYGTSPARDAILIRRSNRPRDAKPERLVVKGLSQPAGAAPSVDGGTLFVGDGGGKYVWAFRVEPDGGLTAGQSYGLLRTPGKEPSDTRAVLTDTDGRIYALTSLGVQILDPTGRLCGVLSRPTREPLVTFAWGGTKGDQLFIATATMVYARRLKTRGLGYSK